MHTPYNSNKPQIGIGSEDGKMYLAFNNSHERDLYIKNNMHKLAFCIPACFGNYDNALCLDRIIQPDYLV